MPRMTHKIKSVFLQSQIKMMINCTPENILYFFFNPFRFVLANNAYDLMKTLTVTFVVVYVLKGGFPCIYVCIFTCRKHC